MLHPIVRIGLLACIAAGFSGCLGGTNCTTVFIYGLNITVVDAASQTPVCDAQIVARDGAYSETLTMQPAGSCVYLGAGERTGTYSLTVTRAGYTTVTRAAPVVRDDSDGCHVVGVTDTVSLTRM